MRVLHVCAGLGGSLLTGLLLDWHSVGAVEWDEWRCDRLRERAAWWPDCDVLHADVSTADFSRWAGRVDCIAAGISCRDLSAAGKGAGLDGPSTGPTWRGFLRAVDAVRPAWCFMENSPRVRGPARAAITAALVARGFGWRDGKLAAGDGGAPHGRSRWWCLAAHPDRVRQPQPQGRVPDEWRRAGDGAAEAADAACQRCVGRAAGGGDQAERQEGDDQSCRRPAAAADALRDRLQIAVQRGGLRGTDAEAIEAAARYCGTPAWNPAHADVRGVVDGLATGRERHAGRRIAGLGDAWVPLQAAAAFIALGGPVGEAMTATHQSLTDAL